MINAALRRWKFWVAALCLVTVATLWTARTVQAQAAEGAVAVSMTGPVGAAAAGVVITGIILWRLDQEGSIDIESWPGESWEWIKGAFSDAFEWSKGALEDIGDFFCFWCDSDEDPAPPPPSPRQLIEQKGKEDGVRVGQSARATPQVAPTSVPPSRPTPPELGAPTPPEQQGTAAANPDVQVEKPLAGDPGSVAAQTDPVSLYRGEFVYTAVDHAVDGQEPTLILTRTYRSRVNFDGPFGPAWDHNFNVRLFEGSNSNICADEVKVSLGELKSIAFRPEEMSGTSQSFQLREIAYAPVAAGIELKLRRHKSQFQSSDCRWSLALPDARRYCFDEQGLATTLRWPSGNQLRFTWESYFASNGPAERLANVTREIGGRTTHTLRFEYDGANSARVRYSTLLVGTQILDLVEYTYNDKNELYKVISGPSRDTYVYAAANANPPEQVPLEGLFEYCDALCEPYQSAGCGFGVTFCQQQAAALSPQCEGVCNQACEARCTQNYEASRSEIIELCMDGNGSRRENCTNLYEQSKGAFVQGCVETCTPECVPICQDTSQTTVACEASCRTSCRQLATNPTEIIYGEARDLQHNLESITDATGRRIVHNTYGQDPSKPSFDAVRTQRQGTEAPATTFKYVDLNPPRTSGAQIGNFSFRDIVMDEPVSDVDAQAPDGTLRLCNRAVPQLDGFRLFPLADGRTVVSFDAASDATEFLSGTASSAFIGQVLEDGTLRLRTPAPTLASTGRMTFGDLAASISRSATGLLSVSQVDESIALRARRVEARPAPTVGPVGAVQDAVLYTSDHLSINDRVQVAVQGGARAKVVNAGPGGLVVGTDAQVGSIQSLGSVTLRDRAHVWGSVTTSGALVRQNATIVDGAIAQQSPLALAALDFAAAFPAANRGDMSVEPDKDAALTPGAYAVVNVKARAKLRLRSGVYYLDGLFVEPDAELILTTAGGPVYLYVRNTFSFRGKISSDRGTHDGLFVGYIGTASANVEKPFSGTIVAPNAELVLASVGTIGHSGSFFARGIEVHQETFLYHHPFRDPWTGPAQPAPGTFDAERSFGTSVNLKLPERAQVMIGGSGTASVTLTYDSGSCRWKAGLGYSSEDPRRNTNALFFEFESCTTGAQPGDTISTASVRLQIDPGSVSNELGETLVELRLARLNSASTGSARLLESLGASPGDLVLFSADSIGLRALGVVTGVASLTRGTCRRGFSIDTNDGEFELSPPDACTASGRLVPLISLQTPDSVWTDLLGDSAALDLEGYGPLTPSVRRIEPTSETELAVEEWARAVSVLEGSGLALLESLPTTARLVNPVVPTSTASAELVLSRVDDLVRHYSPERQELVGGLVADLRLGALLDALDGTAREFETRSIGTDIALLPKVPTQFADQLSDILTQVSVGEINVGKAVFGRECSGSKPFAAPHLASMARDRARARWATEVSGSDRERIISYYNRDGDNLRVFNATRRIIDDFEYDVNHRSIGALRHSQDSLAALEPRTCATVDDRGLTTTVTRIPTDGSAGLTQCFAYDENGPWVTRVSKPGSPNDLIVSQNYDNRGRALSTGNDGAEFTTIAYVADRVDTVTNAAGTVIKLSDYDPDIGMPKRVTYDSTGFARVMTLTYDGWGHVTSVSRTGWGPAEQWLWTDHITLDSHSITTDEGTAIVDYNYYDNGQVKDITDPVGKREFVYDSAGWLQKTVETSNGKSRTTCFERRSDGSVSRAVDPNGAAWTESLHYNGVDRTSSIRVSKNTNTACALPLDLVGTFPNEPVQIVRMDGGDRVVEVTDSAGVLTSYTYDAFGRLFTASQGSGAMRTTWASYYDALNRVVAQLNVDGTNDPPLSLGESQNLSGIAGAQYVTFQEYDAAGRGRRTAAYARHPTNGISKISDLTTTFEIANRRTVSKQLTAAGDYTQTTVVDRLGRLVSETDSTGRSTTATYPTFLRQEVTIKGPEGTNLMTTRQFTLRGALKTLHAGSTLLASNEYDVAGRLLSAQDRAGTTQIIYDGFSLPQSVARFPTGETQPVVREIQSAHYDARGRLSSIFAGARLVSEYRYDLLGRVALETRAASVPNTTAPGITYVGASTMPDRVTLPSGRRITYTYVPGRALVDTITADAASATGVVGPSQLRADFDYTAQGQAKSARLFDGTTLLSEVIATYDGAGRAISETLTGRNHSVSRAYSLGLGLTQLTNNGDTYDYVRDPDGRLKAIQRGTDLVSYQYLGSGPPKTVSFANGLVDTRTFDAQGRVVRQSLGSAFGLRYGYGLDGHTRQQTTELSSGSESLLVGLDQVGRLTSELRGVTASVGGLTSGSITNASVEAFIGSAAEVRQYQLDIGNNWTSVSDASQLLYSPDPDDANAYRTTALGAATYDPDGRMTAAGSQSFRYDAMGRLAEVQDGSGTCSYEYDALGRRITETCNGHVVAFGYDGSALVSEQADGSRVRTIHADGVNTPVIRALPSGNTFLVAGKDNSIQAVFNASGALIERYRYTAYGETTMLVSPGATATGNRFRFQGHVYDATTGLYQMRARYYAPHSGRFITPDPIGVRGGANLYEFAKNRPTDLWDPFGLTPGANPASQPLDPRLANATEVGQLPKRALPGTEYFTFVRPRDYVHSFVAPSSRAEQNAWASQLPPYAQVFKFVPGAPTSLNDAYLSAQLDLAAYEQTELIEGMSNAGLGVSIAIGPVGDLGALGTSLSVFALDPSWVTASELALDTLGVAPGVPPLGTIGRLDRLGDVGKLTLHGDTLADAGRGASQGGLGYASEVIEGGTGRAFAGHGEYRLGSGDVTVPDGTTLTLWTGHGNAIPDEMGRLIEMGNYDEVVRLYGDRAEGAMSLLPGSLIPNYTLKAPSGLRVMANSLTVNQATTLSELLRPGMGHLDWAACLKCRF